MQWYLEVLKKYAVFEGRAGRKEFWMFALVNLIIYVALNVAGNIVEVLSILSIVYGLAVLIPGIAVTVRRFHDTNRSGWWSLIGVIPIVGAIVLLIFMALEGQAEENQYGPSPKE